MPESKAKTPLPKAGKLFWDFIKIGFFTFGGGWSIVAQIQQEFVEKEEWLTQEELLDIVSVGRSLPGIMIANISSIFGYHMAGPAGALACVFGITLPSLLVLTAVTFFLYLYPGKPLCSPGAFRGTGGCGAHCLFCCRRLKQDGAQR